MKFTVATDVNKLLPTCNGDTTERAQLATETNSCTGDSIVTNTNVNKATEPSSHANDGRGSEPGTISAALLLEESATAQFHNVKKETNDAIDGWENDAAFVIGTNHDTVAWSAGSSHEREHLKDGDTLNSETIDWSTVTPVLEAVEKAQSGDIPDIVNATSQLSQLTVSVAMVELDMTNELRHFTPPTRAASHFALDGLGLRADELRRGQKELLIGSNNDFWIRLGADDNAREKEWDRRMELLGSWPSHARAAVSQAMWVIACFIVITGAETMYF
ncbi:hypothetical protein NECAME_04503 [Necator americanus]|uniref:Uncharacterized protein n=1 Tax=Necator americanus TaxID=51031 RepID=W2SRH2_NECAM|nr:hypothetical protein NECAME_04503 [Necator americanus]ETN72324.1 hypothetical protein NECAME_04503 [Necator americanus]